MPDLDAFNANIQRGSLLLDQNWPREALSFIQGAIAADPENPRGYAELARCWNGLPGQRSKVIPAIDAAIGRAPNVSFYYGRKGWYLVCQMRFHAALAAAKQGLAIDPACIHSLNATANAYTKLGRWREAEAACRRILEIDPDDDPGLNLLAQALRHRGKWKESRETVARLLAQMPNNAFGHANAGYWRWPRAIIFAPTSIFWSRCGWSRRARSRGAGCFNRCGRGSGLFVSMRG